MSLRKSRLKQTEEDIDPMASAVNMTDIMLVLAVGFLIFAVMATGSQSIIDDSSQSSMQQQQTTEISEQTTELDQLPESVTKSGSGYQEKGTVYHDPKTGKMVMVSS